MLKTKFKLSDFLEIVTKHGGEIIQDGSFECLENNTSPFQNSLVYASGRRHINRAFENDNVSCVILNNLKPTDYEKDKGLVFVKNSRNLFYEIYSILREKNEFIGVEEKKIGEGTFISPSANLSKNIIIGKNCYIGEHVVIKDNVIIGDNVRIEDGANIGVNGILYYQQGNNRKFVPHMGGVKIEDGAILLASSNVAKSVSTNQYTTIGKECVVGIKSIIGHDVITAERCVISGNCNLARGVKLGHSVFLGASTTIKEYISIGTKAKVMTGSVVITNIKENENISGNFAINHYDNLREMLNYD